MLSNKVKAIDIFLRKWESCQVEEKTCVRVLQNTSSCPNGTWRCWACVGPRSPLLLSTMGTALAPLQVHEAPPSVVLSLTTIPVGTDVPSPLDHFLDKTFQAFVLTKK